MWIVKIGGSLAFAPELRDWLAAVAGGGRARVVVAPGGGTFADEVRMVQKLRGLDDLTAHRMAVLATEQYGLMLCALGERLVAAATEREIAAAHAAGHVPVWMAGAMTRGAPEIPATWDATSDSLAAWLARALGAQALVLVKAAPPPEGAGTAAELARAGYVDKAFPEMARRLRLACFAAAEAEAFARSLAEGVLEGRVIDTA